MKLRLYHGRTNPAQEMNDWGFEGPVLNGVEGLIWTYGVPRVYFVSEEDLVRAKALTGWDELGDGLQMRVSEDMIKTAQGYFGDWELI